MVVVVVVQHVIEWDLATVFLLCLRQFAQMSAIILDCFWCNIYFSTLQIDRSVQNNEHLYLYFHMRWLINRGVFFFLCFVRVVNGVAPFWLHNTHVYYVWIAKNKFEKNISNRRTERMDKRMESLLRFSKQRILIDEYTCKWSSIMCTLSDYRINLSSLYRLYGKKERII